MKYLFTIITLFLPSLSFAQTYYVTHVDGHVFLEHKPLKIHDSVENLTHLRSKENQAEVKLFSPQLGIMHLNFFHGVPVRKQKGKENSELYDIIVRDVIEHEGAHKELTARGKFDLFDFFNGEKNQKRLVIVGQVIPAQSEKLKLRRTDRFFLCDTANNCRPLTKQNDSLVFDSEALTGSDDPNNIQSRYFKVKFGYLESGVYKEEFFPKAIQITFFDYKQLATIVSIYAKGLATVYKNDHELLADGILEDLEANYGDTYKQEIRKLIIGYLLNEKGTVH